MERWSAAPSQLTVLLPGGDTVTTGGVVSTNDTVTLKLALPVFPAASVAVHATVVWPTGNVSPEWWLHDGVSDPSTLSLAVGAEKVTTAPEPDVVATWSPGTLTTGGVTSLTLTVKP